MRKRLPFNTQKDCLAHEPEDRESKEIGQTSKQCQGNAVHSLSLPAFAAPCLQRAS
jgi:hypothetical protein